MRRPTTSYLRPFLTLFFGALAIVGAADFLVDPYDVFGAPMITGVTDVKSIGDARFVKPLQAAARQPTTVYFGTSRVIYGLDPRDFPDLNAYDFGIPLITAAEMQGYARHVIADTPVRRLVIGIDFTSFNDATETSGGFRSAVLGKYALARATPELLLSVRALQRSRGTILDSLKHLTPTTRADGFSIHEQPASADKAIFALVHEYASSTAFYSGYREDRVSLATFAATLAEVKGHGVEVLAFFTPSHAAMTETLVRMNLGPLYEDWRRALTKICDQAGVPLWDFAGFNPITTIPAADYAQNFFDGGHFQPWVGKVIMRTMLGGKPSRPDFGVKLAPENFDAQLAAQAAARQQWLSDRASDAAKVIEAVAAESPGK